jgi:hypothetical protein
MNRLPEEFYKLRSQIKATPATKTFSLTPSEIEELLDSIDWEGEMSWPTTPRDRAIVLLRQWLGAVDTWLWENLSINKG